MAFSDEVIKARRRRSVYLEFSSTHNPGKTWTGEGTRLFGRFEDDRGIIPIKPTVQGLGTVNRSVANFERPIEIPSNTVTLIDEGNEWRAQGDADADTLTDYWLHYILRVADDAGVIYDQKIAAAQIVKPSFPPRKGVTLETAQMLGQGLSKKKPARVVTLNDFPRSAPESINEGVPFIYGVMSNLTAATDYTPAVSGCP